LVVIVLCAGQITQIARAELPMTMNT